MASELRDTIPTFGESGGEAQEVDITNWSALTDQGLASTWKEAGVIVLVAVIVIGTLEAIVRYFDVPSYTFPAPSELAVRFGTTTPISISTTT